MTAYYDRSNLERIPELMRLAPQAAASYLQFEKDVYRTSQALPEKTKELIAVAVAHVAGCPYCIDVHVKKGKALGATREELFEAVLVAASTRAGAILSHATQALIAFGDDGAGGSGSAGTQPRGAGPDCFC